MIFLAFKTPYTVFAIVPELTFDKVVADLKEALTSQDVFDLFPTLRLYRLMISGGARASSTRGYRSFWRPSTLPLSNFLIPSSF